jgi:hypothetical protein
VSCACGYGVVTQAYRHKALLGTDFYTPDIKNSERLRSRRFETAAVWDPTWHGQNVAVHFSLSRSGGVVCCVQRLPPCPFHEWQVSADGKTVTKTQSYWYCLAMAKEGYRYS